MAELALVVYVMHLGLAFGLSSWLQRRRTGSTGFVGLRCRAGSVEWLGGVLFAAPLVLGFPAPLLDLAAVLTPVKALDGSLGHGLGVALAVSGIAATRPNGRWPPRGASESTPPRAPSSSPTSRSRSSATIFAAMLPAP